jgi:hypothetical protein
MKKAWILFILLVFIFPLSVQAQTQITFTPPTPPLDTMNFSNSGANFSGGESLAFGDSKFYASPPAAYAFASTVTTNPNTKEITFDDSGINFVRFFFVHGEGTTGSTPAVAIPPATAEAFDAFDVSLGIVNSQLATVQGATNNYVTFSTGVPIARIAFTGGVIDDITFSVAPPLAKTGFWVSPSGVGGALAIQVHELWLTVGWGAFDDSPGGEATWIFADGPMEDAETFTGPLYRLAGGQSFSGPLMSPTSQENIGTITIQFTSDSTGILSTTGEYNVTKTIMRSVR